MVAAHLVGAVLGHRREMAETGLGDAGRVLLGGMPELEKTAMDRGVVHCLGLENACSIKELRVYPLFLGWARSRLSLSGQVHAQGARSDPKLLVSDATMVRFSVTETTGYGRPDSYYRRT